jgi:hypothetical protein
MKLSDIIKTASSEHEVSNQGLIGTVKGKDKLTH